MSLEDQALLIGKSKAYFYTLRRRDPDLFDRLVKLGNGLAYVGHNKLLSEYNNLRSKLQEVYYTYDVEFQFAKDLVDKGFYSNKHSAVMFIRNTLFREPQQIFIENMNKTEKIYNEFKGRLCQ